MNWNNAHSWKIEVTVIEFDDSGLKVKPKILGLLLKTNKNGIFTTEMLEYNILWT